MENFEYLLSLIVTAAGLLISTLTFAIKFLNRARAKTSAEGLIRILEAVSVYVQKAETFLGWSGSEKKEYVLTHVNRFAIDNKIDFNEEYVRAQIEALIALTKEVNVMKNALTTGGSFSA